MTLKVPRNLLESARAQEGTEQFETLFERGNVIIERIISSGTQASARYQQDHDEWVLLVNGKAEMIVGGERVALEAGDTLHLPAHVPHEVIRTSKQALWLAVHVK